MSLLPWINKYSPSGTTDIPQPEAVKELKDFVENFKKQKKRAALIYGPPGSCKTSAVYAVAKELNLELIEVNASDTRNADQINEKIGNAIKQQSLFFQSKLILIDEVDGVAGTNDRGGIPALSELIASSSFPVVMTANDPWDKKFSILRQKSVMISFGSLNYLSIANVLKAICEKESIEYEEVGLKTLARRVGGDLRAAINDLQSLTSNKKLKKESIDSLGDRDRKENIMNALVKIFKGTDANIAVAAFDNVEEDMDELFLWIDENLPREYTKKDALWRAYDALSLADVFRGRIRRQQHWRFLTYINTLLTAGVATAKDEKPLGFIKYQPTTRILKIWRANQKYALRKNIASRIAEKQHCSMKKTLKYILPYVQHMCNTNESYAELIGSNYELDPAEVEWLKK